ncbi:MAG TPA: glycosyltransferase family 2 protein [Gemmatimonadaceae bacterium]|nr:glycosyltransferase family 2 protein [Gemmatimonadaceae bacterium]
MPPVSGVQHPGSPTWSDAAPLHEAPELRAAATSESDSASPELTILVPCLDEEDNVHITLDHIGRVLREHDIDDFEILVLDDASSDRTFARSIAYAETHPELHVRASRRHEPRRGYGAIVRHGLAHSRGTYCVPVSGDGVDPVELIPEMLARAREGFDLVQCSRYHDPDHARTIPWSYKSLQYCWRFAIRLITGRRFPDSTYAFKLVRRADALARGITSNGFSIGAELFFKTYLADGRIAYVTSPQGTRRHGRSKFRFSRESFGFAYVLLRVLLHRTGILWF